MADASPRLIARFRRTATAPLVIRTNDSGLRIYRSDSTHALATFGVGFTAVRDDNGDIAVYIGSAPAPVSGAAQPTSPEPMSDLQRLQRAHYEGSRHG
jgi:hypothetical protein